MVISEKGLSNPMGFWVFFFLGSRETDPQLGEAPHQALVTTIFQQIPEKKQWSFHVGSHHLVTWVCLKILKIPPKIVIFLIGKMMIIKCGFRGTRVHYFQTKPHGASRRRADELLGWALNFKRCRRWHTQISSQMWMAQWQNFRILRWLRNICCKQIWHMAWNQQKLIRTEDLSSKSITR